MFHFLNKNLNLQLVLLVLLTGWAGWSIFTRMTFGPQEGSMFLFQMMAKVWAWSDIVVRVFALLMVLMMTSGVLRIFQKRHFSETRSYMPGVSLLLLLNCGKFLYTFTPALLTTFFISLVMLLYSSNEQAGKMKDLIFSFGLLMAVAICLDVSAFGIVFFLILMIIFNNVTSFKDILILLLGLSVPFLWAFAVAFMVNGTSYFVESWRHLVLFVPVKTFTLLRIIDYVTMGWFVVVTVVLMLRSKRLLDNKLIVIRQAFNNINLLLISMALFLWLGMVPFTSALLYLLLPVSMYMSMAVVRKRPWILMDLLIVSLCVLLWL